MAATMIMTIFRIRSIPVLPLRGSFIMYLSLDAVLMVLAKIVDGFKTFGPMEIVAKMDLMRNFGCSDNLAS